MTERVVQSQCKDTQLDSISNELLGQALQCVTTKGEFHLAMSTSTSLNDLYARLMYDPDLRAMPWNKMHVWFFGSEEDDDSIQCAITAHSGILEEHVHQVCDPLPQGTTIDCCICDGEDLSHLKVELLDTYASLLVQAKSQSALDSVRSVASSSVMHLFILEPTTQENH